jgi:hypothetical protein
MSSLIDTLNHMPLIKWGLCGNRWVWFHILGGGVLARIFLIWMTPLQSVVWVAIIAVLWEAFEFFIETHGNPAGVYGSLDRWAWDTVGDILGSVACAVLVVL